jgi:hypothetical protein
MIGERSKTFTYINEKISRQVNGEMQCRTLDSLMGSSRLPLA